MSVVSIGVTDAGFTRDRLDVILENLKTQVRGIYGSDIDLDEATPDGQLLGIFAEAIDDTGQAIEDVYNGRNPNAATGQNLTSTATLNGVYRIVGDYAFVDCLMVITAGAVVPAGTQVQDEDTGAVYETVDVAHGVGPSGQMVTCKALVKGDVSAAGKVTKIVKPVFGLQSVTNPNPSTVVDAEETDEQLRLRRAQSTAAPATGFLDAILAGLLAVPGVGKVRLWENDSGTPADVKPGDHALPPHSVAAVVSGGDANAIGAALYARKPPGTATAGDETVTVDDSLGIAHELHYTVADEVEFMMQITYKERVGAGFGTSGGEAAVKAALVAWVAANQPPSGDVYLFHLAAVAQQAVIGLDGLPAMAIEAIQLGRSVGTLQPFDLNLTWKEIGVLLEGNITMEAV